jgi:hypothetical protein
MFMFFWFVTEKLIALSCVVSFLLMRQLGALSSFLLKNVTCLGFVCVKTSHSRK